MGSEARAGEAHVDLGSARIGLTRTRRRCCSRAESAGAKAMLRVISWQRGFLKISHGWGVLPGLAAQLPLSTTRMAGEYSPACPRWPPMRCAYMQIHRICNSRVSSVGAGGAGGRAPLRVGRAGRSRRAVGA